MAEQFFLVWNEKGYAPTVKHPTMISACQEAERLARLNPSSKFHVLRNTGTCNVQDIVWDQVDAVPFNNDIPF